MEDDEFGDLYADVELKASTAVNNEGGINGSDSKRGQCSDSDDDDIEVNGSDDSEDDLNIVLNEDDVVGVREIEKEEEEEGEGEEEGEEEQGVFGNFKGADGVDKSVNGGGGDRRAGGKGCYVSSQFKYMRPHQAIPNTSKGNRRGGDQEENWCFPRIKSSLLGAQSAHQFSLPRSRTILDVNIDAFDEKPWRHPGANITDYFNFGFDEDSWKSYCNRLDQYRHGDIGPRRNLTSDSSNHNGFYEAGTGHDTVPQVAGAVKTQRIYDRRISLASEVPVTGQIPLEMLYQQKGRAIQVAGSISERKSSMDTWRPLDRDSDVVIQINVQDSKEDSSGSVKEEVGHINNSEQGADENGKFSMDNGIEGLSSGSVSEEMPRESLSGHDEEPDMPAAERCSLQNYLHEEVALCDSDGAAETSRNMRKEVGRSTCSTVPTVFGRGSSHDDRSQCSLSESGSDCEVFNSRYIDKEKSYNYVKMPSSHLATELQQLTSDGCHSKDFGSQRIELKHGHRKYSARCRSTIREEHHSWSPVSRSGPRKNLNHEGPNPISEAERLYDAHHFAHDLSRQNEKLDALNDGDGDDISYYNEAEFSSGGKRFLDYHIEDPCTKYPHRIGQQRFKVAKNRVVCRNSDEGEYLLDDEILARDWSNYEDRLAVDSMHCVIRQESRQLNHNFLENERDARLERIGGELQCGERMRNSYGFPLEGKNGYGPPQLMDNRSSLYNIRGRNNFIRKYEEHLPYSRRESLSLRRRKYVEGEGEFWTSRNYQSLSSHSHREGHTANRGRWHDIVPPRYNNDTYERRERRGGYKRQIWRERSGDNDMNDAYTEAPDMARNVSDLDDRVYSARRRHRPRDNDTSDSYTEAPDMPRNVNDLDDGVYSDRSRHRWQPQLVEWTEDENIFRHGKYHAETTFSCKKTYWHRISDGDHITDNVINLRDDMQIDQLNKKLVSERDGGNKCERSSNMSRKGGNHEWRRLLKCGDSVDSHLVNGNGKSFGRVSAAGSVIYNDRHDNMDRDFVDGEQGMFMEFSETRGNMVEQHENPEVVIHPKAEKWLNPSQTEALDIEEGQILTDDIIEQSMEKKNISACDNNVAQISDVKGLHKENATNKNMPDEGDRNSRILEVMAKMEKRRERFKESITLVDKNPKPLVDTVNETSETKQQRPARKRRWGGR